VGQAEGRRYGFGLGREAHIAFAAAYLAMLVTIGAFGVVRFAPQFSNLNFSNLHWPQQSQIAFRAKPLPDPATPHRIAYPRIAVRNQQEGTVVVRLLVLTNGEVGDANLVRSSGYPQLDAAALVGAGNWRYLPALRNGKPVSAEVDVAIRFRLTKS
jgi:TonB family protein